MTTRGGRGAWLWAALVCLLLVGCKRNGPAEDSPSAGAPPQGRGDEASTGERPVGGAGARQWPSALPKDYRRCETDGDCAVAPSLAGLDRPPEPQDRCKGTCYVGVRRDALEAWKSVVTERGDEVPCDKEFEPCPPAEDFRADCSWGRCKVDYTGGRQPDGS